MPGKSVLFIVSISYHASLEQIDAQMKTHMRYLNKYYGSGNFLVSGRKIPRTGGIIVAKAKDEKELKKIMSEDPFLKRKLATIEIIPFQASQFADVLKGFI